MANSFLERFMHERVLASVGLKGILRLLAILICTCL